MRNLVILLAVLFLSSSGMAKASDKEVAEQLKKEIVKDLKDNILAFWVKYSPDPAGGFYGTITPEAVPVPEANKGGILNARLVWTFSTAYRELGDETYKQLADRGARYFIDHFIDKEYGGVYWDLKADGTPANMQKQSYVNAFGIYGLSEHFRATGNIESLQAAISIYDVMIKHVYDPVNGGFIENFSREWVMPENIRSPKGMNNNLHVLEALTNLYRVWRDPGLREMLKRQIDVESHKVLDQTTWHENLYLSMDWVNQMHIDSYGHDIEFSWLLAEAAEVLGDEEIIADTRRIAVKMAEVNLKEGTSEKGYVKGEKFWDGRPSFGPPPQAQGQGRGQRQGQAQTPPVFQERLEWWPQAEGVVGYVNAWQISGDKKYLDAAVNVWSWIKNHVIDYEYGEWYGNVTPEGEPIKTSEKASMWRCPYHNSRMGFEILNRIQ